MLKKLLNSLKRKEETIEKPFYVLLKVRPPGRIIVSKIPVDQVPKRLMNAERIIIESDGKEYPGFIVIEHNLGPLVDVPLVQKYLEENPYIPLNISKIALHEIEEFKADIYKATEIAYAGKWARMIYEKEIAAKPFKIEDILKYAIIFIIIVAVAVVIAYFLFFKSPTTVVKPIT